MSATFNNTWNFTSGDSCNGSQTYHATTTLADVNAGTSKKYTAGSPVSGFVVPTVYEEFNHDGSENLRKSYGWIRDAASNVYANAITTTLTPGASNAVQTITTQQLDAYGNLSAMQVFGYGNSSNTPDRSYSYSYYVNGYIYNRLATATVTANNNFITTASITYDGTTCGALQDAGPVGMHDSTYNVSHTVRGNPTSVSKMGSYSCFAYITTGIPYKAQDATGNTVSITPDGTYSLPSILTPNSNNNLATSLSYSSSWALTSVTGPNGVTSTTIYDSFGRPQTSTSADGAVTNYSYYYPPTVPAPYQQATISTTVNNTTTTQWKQTYLDGFGRSLKVISGHDGTPVSEVDTTYAACACSPLGKMSTVSMPYAPGGSSVPTTYTYDGSGRTLTVTKPDLVSKTTYAYSGNNTTTTDSRGQVEDQHHRRFREPHCRHRARPQSARRDARDQLYVQRSEPTHSGIDASFDRYADP